MDVSPETEWLSAHFADAPSIFTTSPLYRSLCPVVARDPLSLRLLTRRRAGQQPSYLFFGAVHYLLLSGTQHQLRVFYPSVIGGTAARGQDAGPALLDFVRTYEDELDELIRTRLVQTNVVRRACGLLIILRAVKRRCDQPVHLIEVGASAGIHLHFDRYRYQVDGRTFGRRESSVNIETLWHGRQPPPDLDDLPPISSRTGVDLHPVDVTDQAARLWLRALVWPENHQEAALLDAALESIAGEPPAIVAGDAIDICPRLGRQLPAGEPRVVFHFATRMHVPLGRQAAVDAAIDSIAATGPLYHAWLEPPSARHAGLPPAGPQALAMHGPDGDTLLALAEVGGHLEWVRPLDDQASTGIPRAARA
jgi:hypothetical protein